MALTKLDPNVIGQDSTGTGKITSAGGSVSIDSSGNVRIANTTANNVLFAANGTVGIGTSTVLATYEVEIDNGASSSSSNFLVLSTRNSSAQVKRLYIQTSGLDSTPLYTFATGAAGTDPALAFAPAGTERVRIDTSGRLLVGNTAPSQSSSEKFEVYGGMSLLDYNDDSVATLYVRNRSTTANTIQPYIYFTDGGGNRGGIGVKYTDSSVHQYGQGGFNWYTGSSGFSNLRMTVASNGAIYLGNTSTLNSYSEYLFGTANGAGVRINTWGNGGTASPSLEQYAYDKQATSASQEVAYMAAGLVGNTSVGRWNFQTKTGSSWNNTLTLMNNNVYFGYNTTTTHTIGKTFATAHASGNRGARLNFGIDDGSFGGMCVYNTTSSNPSFNSQYITFETHQGGVSAGERMVITADGNVGIGNTAPATKLSISTGTTAANAITLHFNTGANNYNAGIMFTGGGYPYVKAQGWVYNYGPDQGAFSIYTNYNPSGAAASSGAYLNERFRIQPDGSTYNSTGTWGTLSDIRLKENITPADNYLDKLMQLEVVLFSMIEEQKDYPDRLGLIAQQVEPHLPELIEEIKSFEEGVDDEHKAIRYSRLIPMLLKAMQEQQNQINELKAKVL